MIPFLRPIASFATLAMLCGCATLSEDHGFSTVQEAAKTQLNKELRWAKTETDRDAIRARIEPLLAQPLSIDAAVEIALLNNPGLQAAYSELGIAEASLVQAGRLRNPRLSFARLEKDGVPGVEIERQFLFDLLGLITMPARTEIEARRFEIAKERVTAEVLRLAARTRRAWFTAVAAKQRVAYLEEVKALAEAGAELARDMASVGNWSRLEQTREHLFYAETVAELARARQAALAEKEALTRLMGLWGKATQFELPAQLPDLPKTVQELPEVEATAMERRIDIAMARREVEGLAQSLGLTRTTRFVNVLEASYLRNQATGEPRRTGYEIELSIPIFDFGDAKVASAEAIYLQAVNRLAEIAVDARSEVREAYHAYRTAYDLARHYRDEILPLRKRISDENLLRYNGMLIGVFELLADARSQVASVMGYIEALRDFWLAETHLGAAMTVGGMPRLTLGDKTMAESTATEGGH